jgi:predicted esterase
VKIFEGKVKPSWFNVKTIAFDESGFFPADEDVEQIETSTNTLQNIIDSEAKELACGDKTRLIIGGFSGGGVVALNLLLKSKEKLGGCIALSCYIPDVTYKTVVPEVSRKIETPILHCHGAADMALSFKRAKATSKILSSIVQQYDFQLVPDMGHESSEEEKRIIQKFLVNQLK